MQLCHKTILITGATSGIGPQVCTLLAETGATLVLNCINGTLLTALRSQLGRGHHAVVADVAKPEGREEVRKACAAAGGIDAVINLASILNFDLFSTQSEEAIDRMLQVNTVAPILLSRALLPQLLTRSEARILNVGSIFGSIGHPGFVTYCASKAALKSFSEALARELADTSVSVAYLAPRATSTALNGDRVTALNVALGKRSDSPAVVAAEIVAMLEGRAHVRHMGWPDKLLVGINALLPAVMHSALVRKLSLIKHHAQT